MRQTISFLLICVIYIGMFSPALVQTNAQTRGRTMTANMNQNFPSGLQFRLSEGEEGAENREKRQPVQGESLSDGDTSKLLNRLPTIKSDPDDKVEFAKRIGTLPAPKTGNKLPVKFPSDEKRNPTVQQQNTTLEVLRFSPEGEVSLAPDLSVTFSQPMVAVTSQEEAAKYVPVEISPQVEGKWRWLGTKTLMFDAAKRFPMATKFMIRIPAGIKAATGQVLQKDVVWSFTTPAPKVEQMIPANQTTRRDTLMFVSFDQEINPDAVIEKIRVSGGGKNLPIRLATQEEIDKDSSIAYYAKQAQPRRWLAFRAITNEGLTENALPADSPITVSIPKGTPSAEGPITTSKDQNFSFRTFGAMKFQGGWCGYQGNKNCSPFDDWYLQFSNSIEASKFAKEMVKVQPAAEGLTIYPSGNYVYISGYKKGRTTYKISVDGSISDIYGQTLGIPASATITVGDAPMSLYSQGGSFAVIDPTASPAYSIYSTNLPAVKVKIYQVQPADWTQFQRSVRWINYDYDTQRPKIPGRLVSERIVNIEKKADEIIETRIDLSGILVGGFGNAIVDIEPTVRRDKYDRTRILTWVQATQIGLDAFVDNEELVGFATDLKTGKPLSGVELSIFPNGKAVSSEQSAAGGDKGFFARVWNWVKSFGPSADSLENTEITQENGEISNTENIEAAQSSLTTENGILRLPLPDNASNQQNLLIARKGKDVAFLPENTDYYWQDSGSWFKRGEYDSLRWFVFDDRRMYRPKEEVAVKGYIRVITGGKFGDVQALGGKASGLNYWVKDPRGNEIAKGKANLNAFGAFDFKFKLPDKANLGYASVELSTSTALTGGAYTHQFQIQEFRRPEFEVKARNETEAPYFVKESAKVSVEAKYYAGGGLANAETNWTVSATPTNYTPPNREDFTFGTFIPWWQFYSDDNSNATTQTFKGLTDASGKHILKIDFESVKPARPYSVSASASVQDVNRQTWASTTNLLVHPSSVYVGLKIPRYFVQKGESINVESIVSDLDGNLLKDKDVEITAILRDWTFEKGKWIEKMVDEQTCALKSSDKAQKCSFPAKQGGRYTITARVMDDRERVNETEITVWVAGGKVQPKRNIEQEDAQIIPNKKEYNTGEMAELLVMAPFPNAEGVLTLRRDGILKTERFTMKDSSIVLKIPLEERYLPNVYAQVNLVGAAERTNDAGEIDTKLAKRSAFAAGQVNLQISTAARELTVTANPQEKNLAPGGETKVDVAVTDKNGEPVANSEVAVVVVDESVLALSNYTIANPLSYFYTARGNGVRDFHLRKDILLANPGDVAKNRQSGAANTAAAANMIRDVPMYRQKAGVTSTKPSAPMENREVESVTDAAVMLEDEKRDKKSDTPINLRQNFDALAFFAPSVKTDSSGRATVNVKLPDNLTRYRVTAISVDSGNRFGKTESDITAKEPLMVRPSAPRFMNFGDKVELPVVIQNQTDKDLPVDVAIRATNAILTGEKGKRVTVKANERIEVRFPVSTEKAGTARFQFAVTSGKFADSAEIELPVWTPATAEAFATYGTTDANGAIFQPVQTPGDVYPQFGGLEVTTSSTQLQELTDAFIYLYRYPYECSEQIASRMISIAALKDVLSAFKAKDMPTAEQLQKNFENDIKILESRQRDDGSFGLWKKERERYEYPFLTVHVAHALALAKQKGYKVPDEMLKKVKPYLKNVESRFDDWHRKSPQVRWTISAYALYVRDVLGEKDTAKAKKLLAEATLAKLPFEAIGWILSVIANDINSTVEVEQIKRFLINRTTETAATANFVTDYADGAWLIMYSNRRADGVLLEALIKADQKSDIIPKLVRGLLAQRTKGAWSNTQENVFILLALDKYFKAFEKVTPNFVTRIWLGNTYAGEQIFKGRSIDSNQLNIPMSYLTEQGGMANLILEKQGAGRLYYRIGMKYAPTNLKLAPADYGFTVLRKYEAVDNADDVKQNSDGSWTIKSGARVRVRLTMVAQARRYHVALVDNLPAGLEILNPSLAVTETIPADNQNTSVVTEYSRSYYGGWWWRQYWFEHQNFRDERAEAFSSLLWEGVYNYSYVARATTPGQFVVPPAKAEEMYHPETFGRSGTDFVRVE